MIISHEFYLADAIANIALTNPTSLEPAVRSVIVAINQSSLSRKEKQSFMEELKDMSANRVCELIKDMTYHNLRNIQNVIEWITKERSDERHILQLVTALESAAAQSLTEARKNVYTVDEKGHNEYPDNAAWRMLIDDLTLPYVRLTDERTEDEEYSSWFEFISSLSWTMVDMYTGSITLSEQSIPLAGGIATLHRYFNLPGCRLGSLSYNLKPASCAKLLVAGGWDRQAIIPRGNVGLLITFTADAIFRPVLDGWWRVEGAMLTLMPYDTAAQHVFGERFDSESHLIIELKDDVVRVVSTQQ